MTINHIHTGDALETLKTFPDQSVDCCVTSPPYWGLRDYGHTNQLGLERTPEQYIAGMVEVFTEVYRVLKNEGTCWLNIGDSYNAYPANVKKGVGISASNQDSRHFKEKGYGLSDPSLKPKDLVGIPWMLAFALRSAGWYLRQDIIWSKPNPMPESVTDRCTKAHEYIFLLSKSQKYFYDHEAIKTKSKNPDDDLRRMNGQTWDNKNTPDNLRNGIRPKRGIDRNDDVLVHGNKPGRSDGGKACNNPLQTMANKRSVWTVNTMPYSDAHFATFPERLIIDCIKAGCPEGGIVIDPFSGAGTTAMVARKLNRNFVGIELNPAYVEIANKRLHKEIGMFL